MLDTIQNIISNPTYRKIIIGYLVCINVAGFAVMGIDKQRAIRDEWRIPERTLFAYSLLGGSFGTWSGMYFWGHKTRKLPFIIGMPIILWIHATLFLCFFLMVGNAYRYDKL